MGTARHGRRSEWFVLSVLSNSTPKKQSRLAELATTVTMPGIGDSVTLDQAKRFKSFSCIVNWGILFGYGVVHGVPTTSAPSKNNGDARPLR
jgi:hypothetical protein